MLCDLYRGFPTHQTKEGLERPSTGLNGDFSALLVFLQDTQFLKLLHKGAKELEKLLSEKLIATTHKVLS
jgi:hypothetical protein